MGVALKFYSCVGSNHTTLDAIREMQGQQPFGANDIERIKVYGSQVTMDHVGWKYVPQGLTSAQLNLPFCVATYLLEGDCFVEQFNDSIVADPKRMALAEKVEVYHDEVITAKGAKFRHMVRVQVVLKNGQTLEATKEYGRGSERNFASADDIVEKFTKLAAHALPQNRIEQLRDAMLGLDKLPDATVLPGLLAL